MQKKLAAQLDTVHSTIGETLEVLLREKKVSVLKGAIATAAAEINETVTVLATSSRSRALLKTRKSLVSIENTLNGLSNGLESRELSVKDFRAVCSNLQSKSIPNFVQNLADEVSKMPAEGEEPALVKPKQNEIETVEVVEVVPDTPPLVVNQRVKESLSAGGRSLSDQMAAIKSMLNKVPTSKRDEVDDGDDEHESEEERAARLEEEREADRLRREGAQDVASIGRLVSLKAKRRNLPTRLTKLQPFVIAKLPLVPVYADAFIADDKKSRFARTLDQLSMKYTVVQGYAFLEEQLILCISKSDVDAMNINHKEDVKADARGEVKKVKSVQKTNEKQLEVIDQEIEDYRDEIQSINSEKIPKISAKILTLEKEIAKLKKQAASVSASKVQIRTAKAALEVAQVQLKKNQTIKKNLNRKMDSLKDQINGASHRKDQLASKIDSRTEDIKAIRKKARPKYNEVSPAEYAMTVVAHINEISHGGYALVSEDYKVNVRNTDILCFWIMPAAKLARFIKLGTKLQWAFPWDE